MSDTPALVARGLSKRYGGNLVLDAADLTVEAGTVHGLVGKNGAGKSTLVKLLAGVERAEPGGSVAVRGTEVTSDKLNADWAHENHLRFVHQSLGLFERATVAENIALGIGFPRRFARIDWTELNGRAARLLSENGLPIDPRTPVSGLRPAEQTIVAIARGLGYVDTESVIFLDEPTARLPALESDLLFEHLRALCDRGHAVVLVTHRLREVVKHCDALTALTNGRVSTARSTDSLTHGELVSIVSLNEGDHRHSTDFLGSPEGGLRVDDISVRPDRSISFTIAPGEIVGLVGLVGAGQTDILEAIFGARPSGGRVSVGSGSEIADIESAMNSGVAYVPPDRGQQAAFSPWSLARNIAIASLPTRRRIPLLDGGEEARCALVAIEELSVVAPSACVRFDTLSGGNQQKVVLARWLRRHPSVLLLNEPTQGVDVGSRADIHQQVTAAAAAGASVAIVSADAEEIAQLCHRVLVIADGGISEEINHSEITEERILTAVLAEVWEGEVA